MQKNAQFDRKIIHSLMRNDSFSPSLVIGLLLFLFRFFCALKHTNLCSSKAVERIRHVAFCDDAPLSQCECPPFQLIIYAKRYLISVGVKERLQIWFKLSHWVMLFCHSEPCSSLPTPVRSSLWLASKCSTLKACEPKTRRLSLYLSVQI